MNIGTTIIAGINEFKEKSRKGAIFQAIIILLFIAIALNSIITNKTNKIIVENKEVIRETNLISIEDILNYAENAPKSTLQKTWQKITIATNQGIKGVSTAIKNNDIFSAVKYIAVTIQAISGIILLIPTLIVDALQYIVYIVGIIFIM